MPECIHWSAPQQSLQAREKNRQIEGFGGIIVGARGEAIQHIFRTAPGRQHQHRNIIPRGPQFRNHGEPIFAGQHDVEHHGVEVFVPAEQTIGGRLAIAHDSAE